MNKVLAIFIHAIIYLLLIGLIYLLLGNLGLTIISAVIWFPILFYHYVIYLPLNFWRKFFEEKPKNSFFLLQAVVYLFFYIIFIIFFKELFYPHFTFTPLLKYLGWFLLIISVSLLAVLTQNISMKGMDYFNTVFRKETKKSAPLFSSGLYRYIRNPMYVTDITILVSIFLISGTYFSGILAALYIINVYPFIRLEEKELKKTFGQSYTEYCKKTPRFIPNFFHQKTNLD